MKLLDVLRAHWNIWGLDAPKFAWVAAAGLLLVPLCILLYLFWKVHRESRILSETADRVERLRSRTPLDPKSGLAGSLYSDLMEIFAESPTLAHAWNGYASLIVVRRNAAGQEQFWASESAESTFTDSAVLESRLNRGFYNSLPSIVTGTGLLFTFLAILVALLDIRINIQSNQIEGLPLLIEGLSGKFVSSIAALLSATIFLLAEKPLAHRLSKGRLRLVSAMDALVPRLSSTRILVEMHRDIASLAILVNLAKRSTSEQLAVGKSQVKASTAVLRQFLVQMNETAGSSANHMAATLNGVVRDLSNKVNDLGTQMAAALQKSAEQTTTAASTVVEKVDKWSSRSAEQLENLVQELQTHTNGAKDVDHSLMDALGMFHNSLSQFASLNSALNEITSDVNVMSERLQNLTESLAKLRGGTDGHGA